MQLGVRPQLSIGVRPQLGNPRGDEMRYGTLALVVVVCSAVALAGQVPVHQEPLHKPVFENKAVRIIDLSLQPGQASADHIHSNDSASVSISTSDSQAREPGSDWGPTRAIRPVGEVQLTEYAGKPGTHAVRNNGKTLYQGDRRPQPEAERLDDDPAGVEQWSGEGPELVAGAFIPTMFDSPQSRRLTARTSSRPWSCWSPVPPP